MRDPEIPEYLGKAALPGVGKKLSQDRTRALTSQAPIVQKANRGELFALFDGMGSKGQAGADAAEVMCEMVTDFFRKTDEFEASSAGLHQLLLQGNRIINDWGTDLQTGKCRGGCVGSVLWVFDDEAYVIHAGDTAVYCVADRKALGLTSRHCDEQGLITSFFGAGTGLQVDIHKLPLAQCEFLVLVSDGVTDRCSPEDIADIVSGQQETGQAAMGLVRLAIMAWNRWSPSRVLAGHFAWNVQRVLLNGRMRVFTFPDSFCRV